MSFSTFYFGDWQIEPSSNSLRLGSKVKQLEPKAMDVLSLLCERDGDVVSTEEIVSHCWPDMFMGDNPLHKVINQLRRALGDSATSPQYIETIRKRGYRTLAKISFPKGHAAAAESQQWQSGSPFPGLQAYSAEHADVFFGRSEQVSTLLNRITLQVKYGRAFCLILGPSGSGKTSLINAGVMPNLMSAKGYNGIEVISYSDIDLADVVDNPPLVDLASAMLDWEYQDKPVFDGYSAEQLANTLTEAPEKAIQCCKLALKGHKAQHAFFTLFVDRLEVLLSSPQFTDAQRQEFFDVIECLAQSGHILILSACRNDFYPDLVQYPNLMSGKSRGAHFDLSPPTRQELLQMIRLPAVAAKLTWQLDSETAVPLDEMLCADAASNPDALPMLQYTLQALYLNRDDKDQLLVSEYQKLGGLEGAIGKNAEEVLTSLTDAETAAVPKILSLLVTLKEDDKSITSRTARWSQLSSSSESETNLVKAMVDSRLFVSHLQNDEACFSIAHEALLRRWPRATKWIEAHSESLGIKSRLLNQSRRWLAESKTQAYLLSEGKPLQEAQLLSQNPLFTLESAEQALISASAKRVNSRRWRRRLTTGALVALTMLSVLMSFRSIEAEQRALDKRLAAENLLGFMVGDFADKLRGIGRMDLLDGISNKALEYFSDESNTHDASNYSFEARFQHAQTLEAIGEVAYSRGKLEEANAGLLGAKTKLEALLAEQSENLELLKTAGANAFWLGQLEYDKSDWTAAQPWYERYLSYSQTMYRIAPDDADALMELSYAHNTLGSLYMEQQKFKDARGEFKESLRLKLLAVQKQPQNILLKVEVADTRSWIASAELSNGELQASIETHIANLDMLESLEFNQNNAYLQKILALSNHFLSRQFLAVGKHNQARDSAVKSYNILLSMVEVDPSNQMWQTELLKLKLFMLHILPHDDSGEIKLTNLHSSLELELSKQSDPLKLSPQFREFIVLFHRNSAYLYQRASLWQKSMVHIELANKEVGLLMNDFPNALEYKYLFAEISLLDARVKREADDLVGMRESCNISKNNLVQINKFNQSAKYLIPFADSLRCLGEIEFYPSVQKLLARERIVFSYIH
ncbi:winged helix-turn-helix domain-containing protein [Shewanella eurypsychrophilus]|uniref:Winged helix-turn-helix domain-containing protein n=1 Tax=Shewanella eurypsychrophilus TaxID=2593656 RepID=A0ABX6VBD8_9GAMM|nr:MULTISPECIES: winged helix-turn-helix domain-containing protein [Shewanella]QFU24125.1 transcriptional regulator [Shewanella sp. YLB-09]QPG59332.1 winged helix-turn-helix domain-containing protein [Shewanella eurypsychrophilus]